MDCDFLTLVHRTTLVNETEWDGIFDKPFDDGSVPLVASTLVCMVCQVSPTCLAFCLAKINYIFAKDHMTRACMHLGTHKHPMKMDDYCDSIEQTGSLNSDQVQQTSSATNSYVVLEAKDGSL